MASSSAPARESKSEKEREKGVQDRLQLLLTAMLKDEDNKYCVDCDSKGPRWASWNLGLFVCIRCAGIHRNLGVHISKVRSVNLDSWTPQQVASMQQMGNSRARAVYEANLPDGFQRPQNDQALEQFIRAKYEKKKYMAREYVPTKPPEYPEGWFELIEAEKQKKDPRKIVLPSHNNNNIGGVSATRKASDSSSDHANGLDDAPAAHKAAPAATSSTSSLSKAAALPVASPAPVAPKAASACDDLLGLALDNGSSASGNSIVGDFLGLGLGSHTSPGSGLPSSAASEASSNSGLPDGLFAPSNGSTAAAASTGSNIKSKDDIMALFGNMGSTPRANPAMSVGSTSMSMGNVSMPMGNTSMNNSPFGQPQHHSQSLFNMPAQTNTSPFMGGPPASGMQQSSPFGMNPQSNPFLNSSPGGGFGPMTSANPLPDARPQFPVTSNQNQFGGLLGGFTPSTPQQSISSDNNGLLGLWQ